MSGLIFTKKETDQTVSYTSFFSFISIVSHELQLIQDKIIILQVKILFGDQEDIIISSPVLRNVEEGPDLAMIVKSLLHIIADRVEVDLKKPGEFVIMRDRPAEITAEVLHAGAFRLSVQPLAVEFVTIGTPVEDAGAVVDLSLNEKTFPVLTVPEECQPSGAVDLSVHEFAFIAVSVGPDIGAFSVIQTVHEISGVLVAVGIIFSPVFSRGLP